MQLGAVIARRVCRRGAVSRMHDSWKWSGIFFFPLGDLGLCRQLRALLCRTRKENRDFYCCVHRSRVNSCPSTIRNQKLYFDVESRFGSKLYLFPRSLCACSCQLLMTKSGIGRCVVHGCCIQLHPSLWCLAGQHADSCHLCPFCSLSPFAAALMELAVPRAASLCWMHHRDFSVLELCPPLAVCECCQARLAFLPREPGAAPAWLLL